LGKETYLGVQWTTVLIPITSMVCVTKLAYDGYGKYDVLNLPEDMENWLYSETDGIQHSRVDKRHWWWDIDDIDHVKFYFRDVSTAIKFKLTWGGVCR
jgi:hypothetical protein